MSQETEIDPIEFGESGNIPNNEQLPVLVARKALDAGKGSDLADTFEQRFRDNRWTGCWRWGVYGFHHYHSTAHEALGVATGSARLQIGGPNGSILEVEAGDLLVLPAGTGHKCLSSSDDFQVVGCYPPGQADYDLIKEDTALTEDIRKRIREVPLPPTDPLEGCNGPVTRYWKKPA